MTRFVSLCPTSALLVAVALLTLSDRVGAEDRPFFLKGTAQFLPGSTNFVGSGHATHLGNYTEVGHADITGDDPTALQVTGWAILTAANGDELWVVIDGQFNFLTGTITAEDSYVGGTGRFADATGSGSLVAQFQPDGTIAVAVDGTLDF